jgi:hypothetical protein
VARIETCNEPGPWATAAQQSPAEVTRTPGPRGAAVFRGSLLDRRKCPGDARDGPVPMPHDMPVARIEICNEPGGGHRGSVVFRGSPPEHCRTCPGDPRDGPVPMPYDMPLARIETNDEPGLWATAAQQSSAEVSRTSPEVSRRPAGQAGSRCAGPCPWRD